MDHYLSQKGWLAGPWKVGRFSFVVSLDDLWVGLYWGRDDGCLYFCPFPMLVFGVRLTKRCCSSSHEPADTSCTEYCVGMNGRCVYCDHEEKCHPGPGATCWIGRTVDGM